jgi:peptidoglycan/xylan/chitin deacetylase (PgdA/CDA1 family)
MPPTARIVVFTSDADDPSAVEAVEALAGRWPEREILVVAGGLRIRRRRYWLGKLRRLAREPVSYPVELLHQLAGKVRVRRTRRVVGAVGLPRLGDGALANVMVRRFGWIHGADCLAAVAEFRPGLGVSLGAPILKEELFGIPESGTLNVHESLLPEYRGMPPAFWEIHDGADVTGASVHWVERSLDTGAVIVRQAVPIDTFATPRGARLRIDQVVPELLVAAIERVESGAGAGERQREPVTPTRRRPPFLLERRVLRARRQGKRSGSALRSLAKSLAHLAYAGGVAPLRNFVHGRGSGCHASILLYHRISDRFRDSITVGVEQFERHMRLVKARYDVVDMATYLRERGRVRKRPAVVLTFDDGYADNFTAARILRRLGLPCTFFINTRIVGTDRRFPFDEEHGHDGVPALTWAQAEQMAAWGFTLANHTASHVNLAQAGLAAARLEITTARDDLEERVGSTDAARWLAYPFGRRRDMTDEIRDALPAMGIEYCFSAYGGVNPPDFDPRNIRRQGVSHGISELGLRALIEGWIVSGSDGSGTVGGERPGYP